MGCSSTKLPANAVDPDTGLTGDEKTAVRQSWKRLNAQWESKHGVAFFIRLFTNQPAARGFFKSFEGMSDTDIADDPKLKAHVLNFGSSVATLVEKLDDAATLVALIHKLAESHYARGIDATLHKIALQELLSYMKETLPLSKPEEEAWTKTAGVIAKVIGDHVEDIKK